MENHLLRIATINYYDILLLTDHLNKTHKNSYLNENTEELTDSQIKQYYLEIAEELDSCNIVTHYNALSKLLFSFIINRNFNFLLEDNIENNFNLNLIEKSIECGLFEDLIKNLNYFITKFSEFQKK
jgi:hypothetical protein